MLTLGGQMLTSVYCPACGEWSEYPGEYPGVNMIPGESEWTCQACQTEFVVRIEFFARADQQSHAGDGATPSGADGQSVSGDSTGDAGSTNPSRP